MAEAPRQEDPDRVHGRTLISTLLAVLALLATAATAHAKHDGDGLDLPAGFEARTLASGLQVPTGVAWLPDGRMLVAEKAGRVKLVVPGAPTRTLLDISAQVNDLNDRGLTGIAVDADFANHPYLYLAYVADDDATDDNGPKSSRLVRLRWNMGDILGAQEVLLGRDAPAAGTCPATPSDTMDCIPADAVSHVIGTVRADPDGTLWVGNGDSASYTFPDPKAQRARDERSYAGKLLHVDRDGRGLPGHPYCPAETDLAKVCTKVHAKGFRNPFRFSLRPGANPVVGDVGWGNREEVDFAAGGADHGWPCWEGTMRTNGHKDTAPCVAALSADLAGARVPPAWEYQHGPGGSITGGPVYTGTRYPAGYRGSLFVGDYVSAELQRLVLDGEKVIGVQPFATDWTGGVELTPEPGTGDVVWVDIWTGAVHKLEYVAGNATPVAAAAASPASGPAPLPVTFSPAGTGDPDGDALTYRWDFGDGASSTAEAPEHTYTEPGTYTATLTVSDGRGRTATATVRVDVDGAPPVAEILAPAGGARYRGGVPVALRGSASDPQGEEVALRWDVRLQHGTHFHSLATSAGAESSFEPLVDHDADSRYRVTLTATDASGLTATDSVEVLPETVPLTLETVPAGIPVTYAGAEVATPRTADAAVGFRAGVSVPAEVVRDGVAWRFARWSDGGARAHEIDVPPAPTTLTATYERAALPGIRVNAGGPALTGDGGAAWSACTAAGTACPGVIPLTGTPTTGRPEPANPVAPTPAAAYTDAWLGRTDVAAGTRTVAFDVNVPNGRYLIRLHWAEDGGERGDRMFDVDVEKGTRELASFDPLAAAGGTGRAAVREWEVDVADRRIDIDLYHRRGAARLDAFEIVPAGRAGTTAPPAVTGLTATPGEPRRLDVAWENPDAGDYAATRILRSTTGPATSPAAGGGQVVVHDAAAPERIALSALTGGTRVHLTAFVRDQAGRWSAPETVSAVPAADPDPDPEPEPDPGPELDPTRPVVRFSAGGPARTVGGVAWAGCSVQGMCIPGRVGVYGGARWAAPAGTLVTGVLPPADAALLTTEWRGGPATRAAVGARAFGYDVYVPPGDYVVRLHHAENLHTAAGARVFDVNLEKGPAERTGFDVFAGAGGATTAVVASYDVTLVDDRIDIDLFHRVDNAQVSAVEVLPVVR